MPLTRRTLLKTGAAATLGSLPGLRDLAFAANGPAGDILVVVFQRGGCDGLSLLAPVNDPDYLADRTPDLRVREDGPLPGRRLRQACAPALDFRLHPQAAPLVELYEAGALAFVHAAGLENGTRSHFLAQDLMERGISEAGGLKKAEDGWLTRLLAGHPSAFPAVSTAAGIPAALAFHARSLAIPDLRGGLGWPGGAQPPAVLAGLYARGGDPFSRAAAATLADMAVVDGRLPRGPDGKVPAYQPEADATYEETESGRAFQTVARLIRMEIGLSVACIDIGGWDHHENMAGRFAGLVGQFARATAAFWNDMAAWHHRLTVVVMTEFGRRLRSNKSNGTDHGHGGVMMVLGGHVQGGALYGRWPGLASGQLDNGVDLAVTTDYRRVLSEILAVRMNAAAALPEIFPGFAQGARLGIVRA